MQHNMTIYYRARQKYPSMKMFISHKCVNILIPNFPRLLNTHFFTTDVFFYLLT